jgi:hypothetical protein
MTFSRTFALSLLLATGCLVLAWAGMAIGQGADVLPAPASSPPDLPPAATPPTVVPPAPAGMPPTARSYGGGEYGGGRSLYQPDGGYGRLLGENPLKNVKNASDLASLTIDKLIEANGHLEFTTQSTFQDYKNAADDEARGKLKTTLADVIQKNFEVRHEIRRREIAELEAQVKRLRDLLEKRKQAQKNIVDMRLHQFIGAADGLGWDATPGRSDMQWGEETGEESIMGRGRNRRGNR